MRRRLCITAFLMLLAAACSTFGSTADAPHDPRDMQDGAVGGDAGTGDGGADATDRGQPFLLTTTAQTPTGLVTDAEFVYWIEGDSRVVRLPIAGGPTVQIGTGAPVRGLAVDDSHIVWGTPTYHALPRNQVTADAATDNAVLESHLVVRGDAFWLDPTNKMIGGFPTSCTGSCGSYTQAIVDSPTLLAISATHLFYFAVADGGAGLTLHAQRIAGTTARLLASATGTVPKLLAASSNYVFWVDNDTVRAVRGDDVNGLAVDLGRVAFATAIAAGLDGTSVFVGTCTEVLVFKVGGAVRTLATAQARPNSLAATAAQIVWANSDDRKIQRLTF